MKLSDIKLNPQNPRYIKDDKFKKLVESIKRDPEFMETHQIGIKNGVIMAGNMRYRALEQLGYTEIPDEWIKDISKWPDDKVRRYVVVDNLGYGEWDWDLLSEQYEKEELEEWGMDVDKWKDDEVVEDEVPEVSDEPAISKLGEVYQLGRHRLMCGDSTKIEDVEKLMDGKKVDMVFTDPPYGMFLNADFSDMKNNLNFAKDKGFVGGKKYDNVIGDHEDFNPDFINTIFGVFPDTKEIFLWGANYYTELLQNRNDGSWFVWDKRLDESADKMYGSCFELCWSKTKHKQDIARVKWAGVFGTEQEFDHKRYHPTQKPVELSVWFIDKFADKEGLVADLFLGSGSTLIACEQTNRICYGCEIDCKYIDVIIKRWMKFTGERAYKIIDADGKPCNEPVQFADESFMQLKK